MKGEKCDDQTQEEGGEVRGTCEEGVCVSVRCTCGYERKERGRVCLSEWVSEATRFSLQQRILY